MALLQMRFSFRFFVLVMLIIFLSVIDAVAGAFITRPENVIRLAGTQFTLQCVDDSSTINWIYDNDRIIGDGCTPTAPGFSSARGGTNTACSVVVQGNSTRRLSGPFICSTGTQSDQNSEAVIIVIDPRPTCGVRSGGPIYQGQTVTLTCSMTYYLRTERGLRPKADVAAVIGWDQTALPGGTASSTTLSDDGVRLEVQVDVQASGTEIPSYTCTSTFSFVGADVTSLAAAGNQVVRSCSSEPVFIWYCPGSVQVSPSIGPFMEGDVLTCTSDGYPKPSFTWTDTNGVILSTANTTRLPGGWFNVTCTATGNFTKPCIANRTISGFAVETTTTTPPEITTTTSPPSVSPTGNDLLTVVIGLSVGIGAAVIICIIILIICCCCRSCPMYKCCKKEAAKKHGDEGATVRTQPLSDMINRPTPAIPTTYEPLDVRAVRKAPSGTYQELGPPPKTAQGHEYLDLDAYDGYMKPIPELGPPQPTAQDNEYLDLDGYDGYMKPIP